MQKCSKCRLLKDLCYFNKNRTSKSGYQSTCKQCQKEYQQNHKNKIKESKRAWFQENKEKISKQQKEYKKVYLKSDNGKKVISGCVKRYWATPHGKMVITRCQKTHAQTDKGKTTRRKNDAKRRADKIKRTIKLTKQQENEIKQIYKKARELEKLDGIPRHVDHIVPLRGKTVSGLHVPWNLQILTAEENRKKNNKY